MAGVLSYWWSNKKPPSSMSSAAACGASVIGTKPCIKFGRVRRDLFTLVATQDTNSICFFLWYLYLILRFKAEKYIKLASFSLLRIVLNSKQRGRSGHISQCGDFCVSCLVRSSGKQSTSLFMECAALPISSLGPNPCIHGPSHKIFQFAVCQTLWNVPYIVGE